MGSSAGFGEATAKELAGEGLNIFGVYFDRRARMQHAGEVIKALRATGRDVVFFTMNAADATSRAQALEEMEAHWNWTRARSSREMRGALIILANPRVFIEGGSGEGNSMDCVACSNDPLLDRVQAQACASATSEWCGEVRPAHPETEVVAGKTGLRDQESRGADFELACNCYPILQQVGHSEILADGWRVFRFDAERDFSATKRSPGSGRGSATGGIPARWGPFDGPSRFC